MEWLKRCNEIGFERFRRALAALALSLFVCLYLMVSLNPPEGWGPAFVALAACYALAFLGVAAEWFWGRWFASGLGWSGVMVAVASLAMIGWVPALAIYGGLHLLIVLALAGAKMVARYDLQDAWRQRYNMDEFGVDRLRKTVTRASASLPSVILWALAPKEPGQGMVLPVLATLLTLAGVGGIVRLRTWGLLALGAASVTVFFTFLTTFLSPSSTASDFTAAVGLPLTLPGALGLGPMLAAAFLAASVAPFVRPAARFLRLR
jgi:hypothetical protein